MRIKWTFLIGTFIIWYCGHAVAQSGGRVIIIVHPSNPVSKLSRSQLSKYFLKKITTWKDGRPIIPVDQEETNAVTGLFAEKIHRKNIELVKRYWYNRLFSGRGRPPIKLPSDEAVIEFVNKNPNAIGYISEKAKLAGVKKIEVNVGK